MGVEVPESMREVIQVAIDAGEIFDENGRKIEDMSQLGLEFGPTMQQTMATVQTVMERLMLVLEALATFFGVTLPSAAEDGAADIQASLDGIKAPDLTVDVDFDVPDLRLPKEGRVIYDLPDYVPTGGYGDFVENAAQGGLVTEQGIQRFGVGGKVLQFVPRGIDTQPAMLAVGEGVVNRTGMGVLGEEGLRSLNSGNGAGGGVTIVQRFEPGAIQAGVIVSEAELAQTIAELGNQGLEQGGRPLEQFDRRVVQAIKGRRAS
jgi:hypothetical protein